MQLTSAKTTIGDCEIRVMDRFIHINEVAAFPSSLCHSQAVRAESYDHSDNNRKIYFFTSIKSTCVSGKYFKGNAEKVSVAAAHGCAARDCRRQNGAAGPKGEARSAESSITHVIDSAEASPNSLRARDH
jgi:hypothetical protein